MPNLERAMSKFPSPSLSWGKNLAEESIKGLPNNRNIGQLKSYLKSQGTDMLKKQAKYIILNEDTVNVFFEKLAANMNSTAAPTSTPKMPAGDQFMGKATAGSVQKHIIASPIPRGVK